jgi:hypothetical protein
MANRLVDHVWVIDAASADAVTTETVLVEGVRWVGATTDTHEAKINNVANSDTVWAGFLDGAAGGHGGDSHIPFRCQGGFSVPTLDSAAAMSQIARSQMTDPFGLQETVSPYPRSAVESALAQLAGLMSRFLGVLERMVATPEPPEEDDFGRGWGDDLGEF